MMMRQVTRAALALALTVGVLSGPALAGDVDGALKYVPASFTTVVAVDFDAIRRSPFFEMAVGMLDKSQDAKAMSKEIGFDPSADLKTFVLAGPDALMRHEEQFVVILEADLDAERLIGFVKGQGEAVVEKKVGKATLYQVDKEGAFAIDGAFVIAGYAPLVEEALAAKGGKSVASGPLAGLVKRFKGTKGGFAVIAAGKKVQDKLGADMPELAQLTTAGMGLDLSAGARLSVVGNFATSEAASAVATGLESALQDAATDPDIKEMGLAELVRKVTVEAKGKAVEVGAKLSAAEAKSVVETFSNMK